MTKLGTGAWVSAWFWPSWPLTLRITLCPSPTEAGGTTVYPGASRSSRFMDRGEPGKNDVFWPKNLDGRRSRPSKTREHPGAPRFIQVEPRQGHGSSRRLHGSSRFSGRFSTVHPGPCRQNPGDATVLPGSPRRSYGPSRFTTVHPSEVKMQYK